MLCVTGDINGNGFNGDFNCDLIACSAGTWSPIGRATPQHMGKENGFEMHECRPCHKHSSGFLGAVECGTTHELGGERLRGSTIVSGEGNAILILAILCSFVGTLAAFIVYRTRKIRQHELERNINLRHDAGFDTESHCTEATDAHSVFLTKLDPGDDKSVQTEESGTGTTIAHSSGLAGFEMIMLSEHDETLSVESVSLVSATSSRGSNASRQRSSIGSRPRQSTKGQSELWLDVPSI
jgi:hypothetical protein